MAVNDILSPTKNSPTCGWCGSMVGVIRYLTNIQRENRVANHCSKYFDSNLCLSWLVLSHCIIGPIVPLGSLI